MPLTTAEANALLNASTLQAPYPFTTGPTKLALVTVLGDATSAGTEVSGGSYARQTCSFATAASGAAIANTGTVTFVLPTCTVVGANAYDSAATPNRKWWGPLAGGNRSVQAGDSLTFNPGSAVFGLGVS